ncbi:cysteinyl-tRNA synthetase [Planifilum fimeticola]|jgi:cysteinyl-tRNA synthetase|uniref:Cysteine--tRNA ligase n=1 Tax=Planifilum fimeticola TaxID=201975 RepID=A0A2T0LBP0_9BACL|nr:cysteine--tRNA ligase [Planifilum fimeticola]PRX39300.1 cysteinyl-tRNA synthetase [Planifilum fimeticola]
MSIQLYNTLTRKKEPLRTVETGRVKIYVCGPTVYNYIHIGNARVFVFFDVVRRYLKYRGYEVTYVQNLTDVDDKLIKASQETGRPVPEIAETYIGAFFEDMDSLGVERADVHPRATEHIPEMIEAIRTLIDKGYAYERDGDVYFRALSKEGYGKLSHQSLEELKAGARVEVNERKENPLDFALWKRAKPGEISWESPWGRGRPGWHIECSVMSRKYLGDTFDIHAGGTDLTFPHHENEIAQSEALTGKPFALQWMHNGYINMGSEKMSKSLGNIVRVKDLREEFSPRAIRHFLLSAHYRNPIQFTRETMEQMERGIERIDTAWTNLRHRMKASMEGPVLPETAKALDELTREFEGAMDDDFNTASAIGVLFEGVRMANELIGRDVVPRGTLQAVADWLNHYGGEILGLVATEAEEETDEQVEALIQKRQEARRRRDFAQADAIRDQLAAMGIIVEDTPQGVRWRRKS